MTPTLHGRAGWSRVLRDAAGLAFAGVGPAVGFALLRWTGASRSLAALTSVNVGARGGPTAADAALAVLTELCWLGWKLVTPAALVGAVLLLAWELARRWLGAWRRGARAGA